MECGELAPTRDKRWMAGVLQALKRARLGYEQLTTVDADIC